MQVKIVNDQKFQTNILNNLIKLSPDEIKKLDPNHETLHDQYSYEIKPALINLYERVDDKIGSALTIYDVMKNGLIVNDRLYFSMPIDITKYPSSKAEICHNIETILLGSKFPNNELVEINSLLNV